MSSSFLWVYEPSSHCSAMFIRSSDVQSYCFISEIKLLTESRKDAFLPMPLNTCNRFCSFKALLYSSIWRPYLSMNRLRSPPIRLRRRLPSLEGERISTSINAETPRWRKACLSASKVYWSGTKIMVLSVRLSNMNFSLSRLSLPK